MRSVRALVLAGVTMCGVAGCGRGSPPSRPRVALVLKTLNSPFFIGDN
jgi:ABC-type sugar transport system substrate-binding protein